MPEDQEAEISKTRNGSDPYPTIRTTDSNEQIQNVLDEVSLDNTYCESMSAEAVAASVSFEEQRELRGNIPEGFVIPSSYNEDDNTPRIIMNKGGEIGLVAESGIYTVFDSTSDVVLQSMFQLAEEWYSAEGSKDPAGAAAAIAGILKGVFNDVQKDHTKTFDATQRVNEYLHDVGKTVLLEAGEAISIGIGNCVQRGPLVKMMLDKIKANSRLFSIQGRDWAPGHVFVIMDSPSGKKYLVDPSDHQENYPVFPEMSKGALFNPDLNFAAGDPNLQDEFIAVNEQVTLIRQKDKLTGKNKDTFFSGTPVLRASDRGLTIRYTH